MIEVAVEHEHRTGFALSVAFTADVRCLALFGESGAGKSSVLDAIAGLVTPTRGRIVLDGRVLFDRAAGIDLPVAQREIGYVFQDGRLFPHLSVRGNLLYGARARRREPVDFDAVVALLNLAPLLTRRPDGLSGGERQRVAIGRALLSAPKILLLDEPLTGLHREARSSLLAHLSALKQALPVAMVLVSHQPDEVVALADEVVLVSAGEVAGQVAIDAFAARNQASAPAAQPSAKHRLS